MRALLMGLAFISQVALAALELPVDTESEIFGLGIAATEAEAERAALSSVALKLSANIQVEQKENLKSVDGQISSSFEELVNISSGKLVFPAYRVIAHSEGLDGNKQVVISLGKQQLLDFYDHYLLMEYQQLSTTLVGLNNFKPIDAIPFLLDTHHKLVANERILTVIAGLTPDGVSPLLQKQHISLYQQTQALLHRGGWQVVSDSRSHALAEMLSQSISENKLLVQSETNYQFVLSTREQSAKKANQFRTKWNIQIELRQQGQLESIKSWKIALISEPEITHEATVDSLAVQLAEKLGSNILFTLLGNVENEN
ncbi:hypothetical protein C9J01_27510 [Photobacterium rosenbergii]|uniref:LPP20 lipoprotein n=1 Tax=Photobacterium rosenbergii TaxID=294936 RepID=A0A2T3MZA4_9GAMM|nr:hypothetical protein [Photobacterium rosenbergii]PSW05303.1 hypothetical protein C9J01_27510 [Photobacterium rosenbergii]